MFTARLCLLFALILLPLLGGESGVLPLVLFAALAAGGWLGWATAQPRPSLPRLPLRWPLLALLLLTLVTTLTSVYRPASLLGFWQVVVLIGLVTLAAVVPLERRHLQLGVCAFGAAVLLGAVSGLWDWQQFHNAEYRVQSAWENANYYAAFLLISLPLLAVFARHATQWAWKLALGAGVVCGLAALALTQSRGGLLAFFLMLLVFAPGWLWAEGKLSRRGLGLLAAGFVVLVGLTLISPVGKRIFDPVTRARQLHSQMFRVYTWQGDLRMIHARPWLGTGPNTFASAYGQYQIAGFARHAHQIYLHAAAEMGWGGALVLLWLFGAALYLGVRGIAQVRRTELPAQERAFLTSVAIAQGAATFGLLLHGLFDSDWLYLGMQLTLLLQAVLVWRLTGTPAPARQAPRWVRVSVPAVLVLITLLLLPGARAEQLVAQAGYLREQLPAQSREEQASTLLQMAELYRQALRLAPNNTAYLRLAAAYVPADEGEEDLQLAMRLEPTNAANWLNYGNLALTNRSPNIAAAAYRTAERKQPNLLPALYGLSQASWLQGDQPGARAALQRILATIGTPLDQYFPLEVPETWYLRAWYAEANFALRAGDVPTARNAFAQAITAAAHYQHGYTKEAEASALVNGTTGERREVEVLGSFAHEQLATLLSTTDPTAAQQHRAAELADLHVPAAMQAMPFPELVAMKRTPATNTLATHTEVAAPRQGAVK